MNFYNLRRGVLLIILASIGQVSAGEIMEKKSILEVIRGMRTVPIEEAAIQELFGVKIGTRTDNGYWKSYEGKGPTLGDGVTISKFGFMTKNDAAAAPLIYMDISGSCVRIEDIKKEYPDLVSTGYAPSLHDPIANYLSVNENWELKFNFRVHGTLRPDCLVNVGFSSKKWNPKGAAPK